MNLTAGGGDPRNKYKERQAIEGEGNAEKPNGSKSLPLCYSFFEKKNGGTGGMASTVGEGSPRPSDVTSRRR